MAYCCKTKIVWSVCIAALVLHSLVLAQQSCLTPDNEKEYWIPVKVCAWFTTIAMSFDSYIPNTFKNHVGISHCNWTHTNGINICCHIYIPQTTPTTTATTTTPTETAHITTPTTTTSTTTTTTTSTITSNISLKSQGYMSNLNRRGLEILKNTSTCGYIDGRRIANGENTALFQFPWMALLLYKTGKEIRCGGSLITSKYVITAAHCIDEDIIGVRLGEWNLTQNPDSQLFGKNYRTAPEIINFKIAKTVKHPNFNRITLINDVGLIKLISEVALAVHIQPICLPIFQESVAHNQKEYLIAGWGITDSGTRSNILKKAKVDHQPLQFCQKVFKMHNFTESTICAGGTRNVDFCHGDSGGPLFFPAPYKQQVKRYVQFGIVSSGAYQCGGDPQFPGVYTNVVHYMSWITSNLD